MIPSNLESIIEKNKKSQLMQKFFTGSAIGAGIAVSLSIFILKHDINKNYFELSNRITYVEQRTQQPSPPVQIHIYQSVPVVDACIRQQEGVYQVRPC